jgi:hypothetical protein
VNCVISRARCVPHQHFIVSPSDPPRKALKSMPLPLASIQSDPLGVDARQLLNRHAAFRIAIQHRADEVERTCAEHQMRKKERSFFTQPINPSRSYFLQNIFVPWVRAEGPERRLDSEEHQVTGAFFASFV